MCSDEARMFHSICCPGSHHLKVDRFITHEGIDYDLFPPEYIQSAKYQPEVDYEACVLTFEEIDVGLEDLK